MAQKKINIFQHIQIKIEDELEECLCSFQSYYTWLERFEQTARESLLKEVSDAPFIAPKTPALKRTRGRKKKEDTEDNGSPVAKKLLLDQDDESTDEESSRPRRGRAASRSAAQKIKANLETEKKSKLRRPSNFGVDKPPSTSETKKKYVSIVTDDEEDDKNNSILSEASTTEDIIVIKSDREESAEIKTVESPKSEVKIDEDFVQPISESPKTNLPINQDLETEPEVQDTKKLSIESNSSIVNEVNKVIDNKEIENISPKNTEEHKPNRRTTRSKICTKENDVPLSNIELKNNKIVSPENKKIIQECFVNLSSLENKDLIKQYEKSKSNEEIKLPHRSARTKQNKPKVVELNTEKIISLSSSTEGIQIDESENYKDLLPITKSANVETQSNSNEDNKPRRITRSKICTSAKNLTSLVQEPKEEIPTLKPIEILDNTIDKKLNRKDSIESIPTSDLKSPETKPAPRTTRTKRIQAQDNEKENSPVKRVTRTKQKQIDDNKKEIIEIDDICQEPKNVQNKSPLKPSIQNIDSQQKQASRLTRSKVRQVEKSPTKQLEENVKSVSTAKPAVPSKILDQRHIGGSSFIKKNTITTPDEKQKRPFPVSYLASPSGKYSANKSGANSGSRFTPKTFQKLRPGLYKSSESLCKTVSRIQATPEKRNNIVAGTSFIKIQAPKPTLEQLEETKQGDLKKKLERNEVISKKKDELLKQKSEDLKRKNEERTKRAQEKKIREDRLREEQFRNKEIMRKKAEAERAMKILEDKKKAEAAARLEQEERKRKLLEIKKQEEERRKLEAERIERQRLEMKKIQQNEELRKKVVNAQAINTDMNATYDLNKTASVLDSTYDVPKTSPANNANTYQMTPEVKPIRITRKSDDYNIKDLASDDSTDDDEAPKKKVPAWANGTKLHSSLYDQEHRPPNVDNIFPREKLLSLTDFCSIFPVTKKRFMKRTSSAVWNTPPHKVGLN